MAVPANLYRIQLTFALGTDGEVAVTGWHARYDGEGTDADSADRMAEHGYAAWIAGFVDRDVDFPLCVSLDSVKAYKVVDSGPSPAIGEQLPDPDEDFPAWAGSDSFSMPWETSIVATLEAQPDGARVAHPRRYRGRMYLPPMATHMCAEATGFLTDARRVDVLNAVSDTLEYFNDAVPSPDGPQARAVVLSRTGGIATDVVAVSMDNQFDLQKRRQNRQQGLTRVRHADLDA